MSFSYWKYNILCSSYNLYLSLLPIAFWKYLRAVPQHLFVIWVCFLKGQRQYQVKIFISHPWATSPLIGPLDVTEQRTSLISVALLENAAPCNEWKHRENAAVRWVRQLECPIVWFGPSQAIYWVFFFRNAAEPLHSNFLIFLLNLHKIRIAILC